MSNLGVGVYSVAARLNAPCRVDSFHVTFVKMTTLILTTSWNTIVTAQVEWLLENGYLKRKKVSQKSSKPNCETSLVFWAKFHPIESVIVRAHYFSNRKSLVV